MAVDPSLFRSVADDAAQFVATQLTGGGERELIGQPIVLLGEPTRQPTSLGSWRQPPLDALRLCALLLQRGGQLVVLDRPRNRLLIERLLSLAADGNGRVRGDCRLEADLSSAFRDAAAVLVLPGWPAGRPLAWGALSERMRMGGHLFDLRPETCLERPAACGLQVWHLGWATAP